jgi:hypothetical protein
MGGVVEWRAVEEPMETFDVDTTDAVYRHLVATLSVDRTGTERLALFWRTHRRPPRRRCHPGAVSDQHRSMEL